MKQSRARAFFWAAVVRASAAHMGVRAGKWPRTHLKRGGVVATALRRGHVLEYLLLCACAACVKRPSVEEAGHRLAPSARYFSIVKTPSATPLAAGAGGRVRPAQRRRRRRRPFHRADAEWARTGRGHASGSVLSVRLCFWQLSLPWLTCPVRLYAVDVDISRRCCCVTTLRLSLCSCCTVRAAGACATRRRQSATSGCGPRSRRPTGLASTMPAPLAATATNSPLPTTRTESG
jgi:hypothetical protein